MYGSNGKLKYGGENATNYHNIEFDKLFDEMKNRPNDAKRLALINQMVNIVRYDAPMAGGINTKIPVLRQPWLSPIKPNSISQNTLKYVAIDVSLRETLRQRWNHATLWPMVFIVLMMLFAVVMFILIYLHQQRLPVKRMKSYV